QAEKDVSARRCSAKHTQLLSAIDLQLSLRSQLEGLLEVVPPPSSTALKSRAAVGLPNGSSAAVGSSITTTDDAQALGWEGGGALPPSPPDPVDPFSSRFVPEGEGGGDKDGRGSGSAGSEGGADGGLDEIKRRCSMLDVSLRASRREALAARRARDAAESVVREQKEALTSLRESVSDLEASLAREQKAGK
ncbi:unnamed protein product, partial [Laminaria digitata]